MASQHQRLASLSLSVDSMKLVNQKHRAGIKRERNVAQGKIPKQSAPDATAFSPMDSLSLLNLANQIQPTQVTQRKSAAAHSSSPSEEAPLKTHQNRSRKIPWHSSNLMASASRDQHIRIMLEDQPV